MQTVITPVNTNERRSLGIRPGDTVRVHQKIVEKGKSRTQMFEGLVIAVKHGTEAGATFTVRATMSGVGVERIFPLYAPFIEKIEITRRSKVRRAKLYFIREKVAREVRRQLRNMRMVTMSTDDFKEEEAPEVEVSEIEAGDESDGSDVDEVRTVDPTQNPDGSEMTPAEEVEGAIEAIEVQEVEPEAPADETAAEEK